jgi:hypothetical protein
MGIRLPRVATPFLLAALALLGSARPGLAQRPGTVQGTDFVLFWRGDLRIIATRDNTQVAITDAATGALLDPLLYTSNIPGTNPFELRTAGDSFEANNGTITSRIHVSATNSRGPREEKPLIIWTGSIQGTLVHPLAPPTAWINSWVSNVPALAPGSVENGTEIGRDFWGFTTKEMWIFAQKTPGTPTAIDIQDLITNVELDSDDTQVLTPASPTLVFQDAAMEVYYVDQFEDDTFHVTSNTNISLTVGVGSTIAYDWTITPPSWGPGEDGRELGTLFYTFVGRDLTIFPTQDNTTVTITDLTDGDDGGTFTLREGNLAGDYDIFLTDTYARNGTGVTPKTAFPAVRLNQLGAAAPFENDLVKVEADRPILLYVGPKASDTSEYADVAYAVRTGPAGYLAYAYAQNGGAEDFQVFAYDPVTNIRITSLTFTTGFRNNGHHDYLIPTVTPWLGGNAVTNDWYWASGIWNGELLRIEADGPLTIIDGDYDSPNFGCFIPFVSDSGLLKPIADAGPDLAACPGSTSVTLNGSNSFDADSTDGIVPRSWTWDVDPTVDANGDGNFVNDPDLVGVTTTFNLSGPGPWTITLTYTDDDGQTDTDILIVTAGDSVAPALSCPVTATGVGDPATGLAFVNVLATITDNCDPNPLVTNDRTAGGLDASDLYPCGITPVTFLALDASGNATNCVTSVIVTDPLPPTIDCPALVEADADALGQAFVPVLASVSDGCDPNPTVTNDRTLGGLDASDTYPCGETLVTFFARDAGANESTCVTRVLVHDITPPTLDCPARIDQAADTPMGTTVIVLATVSDVCDPDVPVANDRTAGGLDATDLYPCGETPVIFSGTDDSGNLGSCTTTVNVFVPTLPVGMSPALRVQKVPGMDQYSTCRLHWETAVLKPWEHWEIRRTQTDDVRPYPLLFVDPAFVAMEHIDATATGLLYYYQVHTVSCAGDMAPDVMALSP